MDGANHRHPINRPHHAPRTFNRPSSSGPHLVSRPRAAQATPATPLLQRSPQRFCRRRRIKRVSDVKACTCCPTRPRRCRLPARRHGARTIWGFPRLGSCCPGLGCCYPKPKWRSTSLNNHSTRSDHCCPGLGYCSPKPGCCYPKPKWLSAGAAWHCPKPGCCHPRPAERGPPPGTPDVPDQCKPQPSLNFFHSSILDN